MNDNPEFHELSPEQEKRAALLATAMDPTIAKAVRLDPDGPVAHAVLASGGSTDGVLRELSKMGDVPMPADLEQKVQQYEATQEAQREAANRSDARLIAGVLEAEWYADQTKRNTELSKANTEAQEQQHAEADKQRTEKEKQFSDVEKMSKMGYEEWANKTNSQRAEENQKLNDAEETNDKDAEELKKSIKSGYLERHGNTEEAQLRYAEIEKGLKLTGTEREAFLSKLTPEEVQVFNLRSKAENLLASNNLSLVVITAHRSDENNESEERIKSSLRDANEKAEAEGQRHDEIVKAKKANEDLNNAAATGAPDLATRKEAAVSSDSALKNADMLSTTQDQQDSLAAGVRADNLDARKSVADVVAKSQIDTSHLGSSFGDDEPTAPVASNTAPASAPVMASASPIQPTAQLADPAASSNPADNTNDLGALQRSQVLMAAFDAGEPKLAATFIPRPSVKPAASI